MTRKHRKSRPWEEKLAVFIVAVLGVVTWVASHSDAPWARAPMSLPVRLIGIAVIVALGGILARYAFRHWNDKD